MKEAEALLRRQKELQLSGRKRDQIWTKLSLDSLQILPDLSTKLTKSGHSLLSDQKKIIEDAEKIPVKEENPPKFSESNQQRLSGRKVGKILGVKSEDSRFYIPDSNNMFTCRSTGEKILFSKVRII